MKIVLKVLVALISLLFVVLWLRWMLQPEVMAGEWALAATGPAGINNLRGDIGGLFLTAAVFCGLWLVRGDAAWLRAAAVAMCCVLLGRVIGLLVEGFNPASMASAVLEAIFVTVFLAAAGSSKKV